MTPKRFVALLFLVAALVGCGESSDEAAPSAGSASTTVAGEPLPEAPTDDGAVPDGSSPPSDAWVPLESAEGGFRVELPTEATLDEQTVDAAGLSLELSLYTAQVDAALVYNASFVDYPEEILGVDPQLVLDGVVQGAAANVSGTVASQTSIEVLGFPATDYVVEVGEGTVQARAILVDRRLHILQRAGEDPDDAGFARMVDSFELLDA